MKIFLHKLTVSCMFCTMVVCFALAGCQDVVRRVDDKYRPVKEPGSVTVLADRADDLGVPIQIKNLSVDELELKVSSSDNSPVPFVPILEEGVQAGFGRITITPPSSDEPFGNFTAVIDVCSKETGEVYDSYEYSADRYPYRIYQVGNETYKFELVKMFHCDGGAGNPANNSPTYEPKEMTFNDSIMTLQDGSSDGMATGGVRDGTTVICSHTGDKFVNNGYDYFEVKFRSGSNVASVVTLKGAGSFTFAYDSGVLTATGGSGLSADKLKYDDTSADWVTLGFWNSVSDTNCLFVEDYSATAGTANASSLTNNTNHNGVGFACLNVDSDDDSPTEIDYIAFFKRVEQ